MPKLESCRLNGVAIITKTYTYTDILRNIGNMYQKNCFFAVIDYMYMYFVLVL